MGEICVKSSALFKRYISLNPGDNGDVFDSEGFYKTGDLGRLDGGLVFVTGRITDGASIIPCAKIIKAKV
jgi:long-subunit acyl-CoA synthetase (AMP-forming)